MNEIILCIAVLMGCTFQEEVTISYNLIIPEFHYIYKKYDINETVKRCFIISHIDNTTLSYRTTLDECFRIGFGESYYNGIYIEPEILLWL